jgi:hypothetical protein
MLHNKIQKRVCGSDEKNSNNYLRKYRIEIITIIIAVCGGIPGIISIVNYFRDRPILGFLPLGRLTGISSQDNQPFLLVFGSVTNKGTKPLNPIRFYLKIKVNGEWKFLHPDYIPDVNYVFDSDKEIIEVRENLSEINLEEWKDPILVGQPANGCLMFRIDKDTYNYLKDKRSLEYRLICQDIYNNEYTYTSTMGPFDDYAEDQPKKILKYNIIRIPK